MRRHMESALDAWADRGCQRPLLVTGVRGCGKTHTVRGFVTDRFGGFRDACVSGGAVVLDEGARNGDVVIIDGVRTSDDARVCSEYAAEHAGEFRLIVIGSISEGFGDRFDRVAMMPMSFSEYLSAMGRDDLAEGLATDAGGRLDELGPLFEEFTEVGGMPEAVLAWRGTRDGSAVDAVLERTIACMVEDSASEGGTACGRNCDGILRSLPRQLSRRNKKFVSCRAVRGARSVSLSRPLHVLESMGAVRRVGITLQDGSSSGFKLFCCDTGILRVLAGLGVGRPPDDGDGLSKGMAENAVLLEVVKTCDAEVGCWRSGNRAEAELVVEAGGRRVAVEVDPEGAAYARSLREYARSHPEDAAVHMSPRPPDGLGFATSLPLYAGSRICSTQTLRRDGGRHRKAGISATYTGHPWSRNPRVRSWPTACSPNARASRRSPPAP